MPAAPLDSESLLHAPKVLLHDHLDGGLRPQTILELAEQVVRYRNAGVVGFDLAGPEAGFPPDRIPEAIALLDRADAHRTIHAGEAAGIASIRAALDGARAERLGHGVRIADEVPVDGPLGPVAQRVLDHRVPLEVAPSSNVQTGAYP